MQSPEMKQKDLKERWKEFQTKFCWLEVLNIKIYKEQKLFPRWKLDIIKNSTIKERIPFPLVINIKFLDLKFCLKTALYFKILLWILFWNCSFFKVKGECKHSKSNHWSPEWTFSAVRTIIYLFFPYEGLELNRECTTSKQPIQSHGIVFKNVLFFSFFVRYFMYFVKYFFLLRSQDLWKPNFKDIPFSIDRKWFYLG